MSEVAVGGADAASLLSPPDINGRGDRLRNGHGSGHFPGKGTRLIAWRSERASPAAAAELAPELKGEKQQLQSTASLCFSPKQDNNFLSLTNLVPAYTLFIFID
ncbi:hypothetical protein GOODEAATRI_029672 [Goodea atripinnis]|uniref:Uncharacterized protein n=1 Tax=Goodea atripinnis TaxID=208336 RepID=A0ABV0NSL3_9TELE